MTKRRAAGIDCGASKNRNGIFLANEAFRRSQDLRRRHFNRIIRQFQSVHHLHTTPHEPSPILQDPEHRFASLRSDTVLAFTAAARVHREETTKERFRERKSTGKWGEIGCLGGEKSMLRLVGKRNGDF